MLDIRFVRENPDAVKENIKKKFQDSKLPLVDEVIRLDAEKRATQQEVESLKAARNKLSKANGPLFGQLKKCEDEAKKAGSYHNGPFHAFLHAQVGNRKGNQQENYGRKKGHVKPQKGKDYPKAEAETPGRNGR